MQTKKVSVNKMDKVISYISQQNKELFTSTIPFPIEDGEVTVIVKHMLSFDDFNQCVYDIVSQCFQEERGRKVFYAAKKAFAYRIGILMHYTNIKININQAKLYQLAYSEVYDKVFGAISPVQLEQLYDAVEEQLEYEKNVLCEQYEKIFNEKIAEFDKVLSVLSELGNIDPSTIQEIVNKLKSISEKDVINTLRPDIDTAVMKE